MGMQKTSKYIKVTKTVYEIAVRSGMPAHKSKYSKKIFNQWIWVTLLVLRQYERKDYRGFIDWLEIATPINEYLELKRIPHYTSLQKAAARLDSIWLRRIIARFVKERDSEKTKLIGIDSTGYRLDHASKYYQTRLTHHGKKHNLSRKFLKSTISVELNTQLITAFKQRRGPANDNLDFPNIVKNTHKAIKADIYIADKGYDSEENHKIVRDSLNASCIIPPKFQNVPIRRTKGKYRKDMKRGYCRETYNQRAKIETVNSVVKRKMGDIVYSKKVSTQNRELELRYIAYNAKRYVEYFLTLTLRISTELITIKNRLEFLPARLPVVP